MVQFIKVTFVLPETAIVKDATATANDKKVRFARVFVFQRACPLACTIVLSHKILFV